MAGIILAGAWLGIAAAPVPPTEYVFVADTSRRIELHRGGFRLFGAVDTAGYFEVTRKVSLDAFGSMPFAQPVNNARGRPYKAFEFRSGRLILGMMTPEGDFLPEVGAKVIRFEDYKYSPDVPCIWNLPGYYMRKDQFEERRQWLAEHVDKDPTLLAEKARLDAAAAAGRK